eukprot:2996636-Pyramimonas_sp.AAC.1
MRRIISEKELPANETKKNIQCEKTENMYITIDFVSLSKFFQTMRPPSKQHIVSIVDAVGATHVSKADIANDFVIVQTIVCRIASGRFTDN